MMYVATIGYSPCLCLVSSGLDSAKSESLRDMHVITHSTFTSAQLTRMTCPAEMMTKRANVCVSYA